MYTYDQLSEEIKSYIYRDDPETVAKIPNFITLAVTRIMRDCPTLGLIQYTYGYFTPGVWIYAKTGNWQNTSNFSLKDIKPPNTPSNPDFGLKFPLKSVQYSYIWRYAPDTSNQGRPIYYSDYDYYNFYVAPTPDFAYPIEFSYFNNQLPVNASMQTNYLLEQASDLMLKASLLEAQFFVVNKDWIPIWQKEYDERKLIFNKQDAARFFDSYTSKDI